MQNVMTWHGGPDVHGWIRRGLLAILLFEAVGALIGGPMLVAQPDGHLMKIPLSDLHGVFPSFFIPGLLLTFLGLLNGGAFVALLLRMHSAWAWVEAALGGFLIWFVVELSICGYQSWAQAAWGVPVLVGLALAGPWFTSTLRQQKT